jgi:hypothetical protein
MSVTADPIQVRILPGESEVQKQLVYLGLSAAAMIGMLWLQRKLSGPDAFLTGRMKVLSVVQDYADGRAKFWGEVSAKASKLYLDSRH